MPKRLVIFWDNFKILLEVFIPNTSSMFYSGFKCAVDHEGELSEWFDVLSGVRQGCVMSGLLFLLVIDWVMRKTTRVKRGLRWGLVTLEDLDFADDLALLSMSRTGLQRKTNELESFARQTGLCININKTKVMEVKSNDNGHVLVGDEEIECVDNFTYLGAVIDVDKGATADITSRLRKARHAFWRLKKVWSSNQYSKKTKLRIYKSNVMSVLLYGAECWKVSKSDEQRLNVFHNRCLRKIMRIFWLRTISNVNLYEETEIGPISDTVKSKRWRWIGHVLRKRPMDDCRVALSWTPVGRRNVGRPKETWRRMVDKERRAFGWTTWGEAAQMAGDRAGWRIFVNALCDTWRQRDP